MLQTEKCFNGCELEVALSHISLQHEIALLVSHVRRMDEPWCASERLCFGKRECLEKQRLGNGVSEKVGKRAVRKGRMSFCL